MPKPGGPVTIWEDLAKLRKAGRELRERSEPPGEEEEPPGGWAPVYDEDGKPVPSPPPSEPTDVPMEQAEEARRKAGG